MPGMLIICINLAFYRSPECWAASTGNSGRSGISAFSRANTHFADDANEALHSKSLRQVARFITVTRGTNKDEELPARDDEKSVVIYQARGLISKLVDLNEGYLTISMRDSVSSSSSRCSSIPRRELRALFVSRANDSGSDLDSPIDVSDAYPARVKLKTDDWKVAHIQRDDTRTIKDFSFFPCAFLAVSSDAGDAARRPTPRQAAIDDR